MKIVKFIKHVSAFSMNPEKAMQDMQKKQGDPFLLQLTPNKGVWISGTAAAAKSIFSAKPETFATLNPDYPIDAFIGSSSLIALGGKPHLQKKRIMQPLFSNNKMKLLIDMMQLHTLSEMKKWQVGERINISAAMRNITLDVISTAVLSITDPKQITIFKKLAPTFLGGYTLSLGLRLLRNKLWYPWRKFVNAREKLEQFLLQEIRRVKQTEQTDRNDILSALTTLSLSDTELCNELKELLLAGYDTLHLTLAWAIFYAYSRPEIHKKLLVELKSSDNLSIEDIVTLPYLDAVCKEALRHSASTPLVIRTLAKPHEFCQKHLPAGSDIALSIPLLHNNPTIWKDPTAFSPDRFLAQKFSNYEYIPFGGGIKKCLGEHFAMHEMKIVLATLLLNCRFANIPKQAPSKRLRGITVVPKKPIFATIDSVKKGDNLFGLG